VRGDKVGAVVHGFSNLFLVGFCWVGLGCLKVVIVYEVLYFVLILLCGDNY